MNAWEVIKEKYGNKLTDQNTEDLLSRRIWKGLGMSGSVNKNINKLELYIRGQINYEEPLFDRLKFIFEYGYAKKHKLEWHIETLEIKNDEDALDHINEMLQTIKYPILMTRIKNTSNSFTFSTWDAEKIPFILTPQYSILATEVPSKLVAVQTTTHFVEQFGPYDIFEGA
ncbi:hypothetical protein ACFLQL_00530 [Verrucomicrobiota bacterium]